MILAARGIVVSYETIREWGLRFGRLFANDLKRRRPRQGDKWFIDEVLILSANSRSCCQSRKARHAGPGPWLPIQPVHYSRDVHCHCRADLLKTSLGETGIATTVFVKGVARCPSRGVSDFAAVGVALGVEADIANGRPVPDLA